MPARTVFQKSFLQFFNFYICEFGFLLEVLEHLELDDDDGNDAVDIDNGSQHTGVRVERRCAGTLILSLQLLLLLLSLSLTFGTPSLSKRRRHGRESKDEGDGNDYFLCF